MKKIQNFKKKSLKQGQGPRRGPYFWPKSWMSKGIRKGEVRISGCEKAWTEIQIVSFVHTIIGGWEED